MQLYSDLHTNVQEWEGSVGVELIIMNIRVGFPHVLNFESCQDVQLYKVECQYDFYFPSHSDKAQRCIPASVARKVAPRKAAARKNIL